MKRTAFLFCALLAGTVLTFGQGARNIKLNEVMTCNKGNLQDEYGRRNAWIELANTSFSTYDVRGMFITTDRRVLDKNAQDNLISNIVGHLGGAKKEIQYRQAAVFFKADREYGTRVAQGLKLDTGKVEELAKNLVK